MNITDTRRENLKRWIADNGTPPKEKSLFSQLKGDGSFGEKVARRLEEAYKMGAGFLDAPILAGVGATASEDQNKNESAAPSPAAGFPSPPWMDEEAFKLLGLFYALDVDGRQGVIGYLEGLVASGLDNRAANEG